MMPPFKKNIIDLALLPSAKRRSLGFRAEHFANCDISPDPLFFVGVGGRGFKKNLT